MFGDLFGSVASLAESGINIVAAPVRVAASVANVVVKPIGDVAKEIADDVEDALKD